MLLSVTRNYKTFFSTNNGKFAAQAKVVSIGNQTYNLFLVIGAFGIVICLILAFITMMLGKPQQHAEAKHRILGIIIMGIVLFSISGFIGLVFQVSSGFKF